MQTSAFDCENMFLRTLDLYLNFIQKLYLRKYYSQISLYIRDSFTSDRFIANILQVSTGNVQEVAVRSHHAFPSSFSDDVIT